jgi:hypothetical protein
MKRAFQLLSIPLALVLLLASMAPSVALDRNVRLDVMSAVVQIGWAVVQGDDVYNVGIGSGTIISADGLILTNCHVADPIRFGFPPEEIPEFQYLGVALTARSDRPPQVAYLAEVVQADPYLDLAVIRITRTIDLRLVDPDSLNLPYVEIGDSDVIEVGDELNIFGYPGIGGETVTFTKGVVSGFSLDAAIDGRAWIKTDATIAGGNSGGTAVDKDGYLVGVPTRAGAGGGADYVDCRPLADTNGDGRLDENDTCVPVGGFINALRPLKLASPLIEKARMGVNYSPEDEVPPVRPPVTGQAAIDNLFFSSGVNEFNQPTRIVASLPSGSRSLYLFFDYENMAKGVTLEMKVEVDGKEYPDWGLPAGPWGGSEQGSWWIGWDDADFSDGTWEMTLYVDGEELAQAEIEIGGRVGEDPSFEDLTLSVNKTSNDEPEEPTVLIPAGTREFFAFFDYENMTDGNEWTRIWYVDGEQALVRTEDWEGGGSGSYWFSTTSRDGLSAGAYRIELYAEDELASMTNFWVTGGPTGGAAFEDVIFAEGIDSRDNPVNQASSFASGLEELHAFSGYEGMEDGLSVVVNWYLNEQQVVESPFEWDGGESGQFHDYLYSTSGMLPDGEYAIELVVEEQVVVQGTTTIGVGNVPTPEPTPRPEGVQLEGVISDLDTGRPIPGAIFLVLNPGITYDAFQWTDAEVYTADEADRNGFYQLPDLLERGECYTMIIGGEGYWTYAEDDICLDSNAPAVIDLPVRLEKK